MNNYIMYHCHTDYSLLDSCSKPKEYVALAVENGMKAISFSEHGKPLNWTEKYSLCKEAGLKYIHSVEIYMTETLEEKVRDNYHTVLIAKNMDGLLELNNLISRAFDEDHFYYTGRITFDEFLNISDNIISTSACLASPLNKLPEDHPMYMTLAKKYTFLEVQPHKHPEQQLYNKRLLDLSRKIEKPLIAGTDTHSSSDYKAECRSMLLKSKHKSYGDEDAFDLTFKTYDELVELFAQQGALTEEEYIKAINNTNLLADMTENIEIDTSIKYPILYGDRDFDRIIFRETVERKFKEKCENGIIPASQIDAFKSAISEEMRVFGKLKMDGFMLSMSELVSWCKSNGMAIGTARGSVGGSRVAYVTDIIDLNPEEWHTVFSRFANEDREEIGDIDIDLVEDDRPKVFDYIIQRFGSDKTARVASFGTIQSKGVIDDVGRALALKWEENNPNENKERNPWSLKNVARIKSEFDEDPEWTKDNYPDLFYYFDGLIDTKISQSVHPAGIIISPITLRDNYGVFEKDGEPCMMLDMECVHDIGLAKYDFLILKTVQVIRDACRYLNEPYPKTYEINWDDQDVWADMIKNPAGIFQFEGNFAFESLKKFKPKSIFDMSLVTACIRPTGASYRNDLLSRKIHKNPSEMIDNLLKNNLGYLVYQEDTIAFLQQICGLSGSESDNIRRAIGRKQKERLDEAMPRILEGYCSKSNQPRETAEKEAEEFLQVIEDSAAYQFGYNHSVAYCMLGYLCAYYRFYHPLEFITSYLNNAANDDDIRIGTEYAKRVGISVTMPKFGISRGEYAFDTERNTIAKGLNSIKYMGTKIADELFDISHSKTYPRFTELLFDLDQKTSLDTRQLEILIKIDFFSDFGNQRELLTIVDLFYNLYKKGQAKQIAKTKVDGTYLQPIIEKYAVGTTKSGGEAKSYTLLDVDSIIKATEDVIIAQGIEDFDDITKVRNFEEALGYLGYSSGREEDRKKLYITDVYPVKRKKDGVQFGYSVCTKSIGSGKESRFTALNKIYNAKPVKKGDIIYLKAFERDGIYFKLTGYDIISKGT